MKPQIDFDEFLAIDAKLEIKMGTIKGVQRVPKSDKMLALSVDFAEEQHRIVLTNIGNRGPLIGDGYMSLVDKQFPFITNLKPRTLMGFESQAMIVLPEDKDGNLYFDKIPDGTKLI